MGRTAGTPNKITKEVRGKLDNLINSLVNSIDVEELDMNQRIKMLQIALYSTLSHDYRLCKIEESLQQTG